METEPKFVRRQLTDEALARQMAAFEQKYGISSEAFLKQYNAGELGDDVAFIRWAGLLAVARRVAVPGPAPA